MVYSWTLVIGLFHIIILLLLGTHLKKKCILLGTYIHSLWFFVLLSRVLDFVPFYSYQNQKVGCFLPGCFLLLLVFTFYHFVFFFWPYIPFTTVYVSICFLQFLKSRASKWHVWQMIWEIFIVFTLFSKFERSTYM